MSPGSDKEPVMIVFNEVRRLENGLLLIDI